MAGRRSGRAQKNFDYTSLLENDQSDEESDDDFVGSSAPPSKKAKSSQEESVKKSFDHSTPEKKTNSNANKGTKPKRKKLDDKLFERDIKMAMEMSMHNIDTSLTENTPESKSNSCEVKSKIKETLPEIKETLPHKELLYLSRHDIHSPPKSPPVLTLSVSNENELQAKKETNKQPVMPILTPMTPIMKEPSDDIEFLGLADVEEKKQNRNRRTSGRTAKKKYISEDSGEDNDDNDSEFEEQVEESSSESEENSDFEEKPSKSKKKKQIPPPKSKKEIKKPPASTSLTLVHQKTEVKKSISSYLPSAAKPSSTDSIKFVHKTIPSTEHINFTSPVNVTSRAPTDSSAKIPPKMLTGTPIGKSVGSINNLKSPPSLRRLGLSRNQKVKPLHPTLKANH